MTAAIAALPDRRYSVPIMSDSMVPRCNPGQMAVADPDDPAQVGKEVLVYVQQAGAGELTGHFGRLVRRSIELVEIEQLNPPKIVAFDAADVVAIHRVIGIFDAVVKL